MFRSDFLDAKRVGIESLVFSKIRTIDVSQRHQGFFSNSFRNVINTHTKLYHDELKLGRVRVSCNAFIRLITISLNK